MDDADSRAELVGDAIISLTEAYDSPPTEGYDKWHELKFKGKYAGEVYLEMTFYPSQPRKYKKSASRASSTAISASSSVPDLSSSCASSFMNLSVASRPLPNSPIKPISNSVSELRDSLANLRIPQHQFSPHHALAASVSNANSAQMGRAPLPTSLSVPVISDLVSSTAPRAPPHRTLYGSGHNRSSKSVSLTLTDEAISNEIDMPSIPPEPPHHFSSSTASSDTVETITRRPVSTSALETNTEFDQFFNASIDAMPSEQSSHSATNFYSSIANVTPARGYNHSPLSQSSSSEKSVDTIQPISPVTPQFASFGQDEKRSHIRRKPVETCSSDTDNLLPVLPYPGASYTTDPTAPNIEDDKAYRNVPFSADSYFSVKPELIKLNDTPPTPPKDEFDDEYHYPTDTNSHPATLNVPHPPSEEHFHFRHQKSNSLPGKNTNSYISNEYQMGNGNFTRSGLRQPAPYLASVGRTSSIAPPPTPPAHKDQSSASVASTSTIIQHKGLEKSPSILCGPRKPESFLKSSQPNRNSFSSAPMGYQEDEYHYNTTHYDENDHFSHNDYRDDYFDDSYGSNSTLVPVHQNNHLNSWN